MEGIDLQAWENDGSARFYPISGKATWWFLTHFSSFVVPGVYHFKRSITEWMEDSIGQQGFTLERIAEPQWYRDIMKPAEETT